MFYDISDFPFLQQFVTNVDKIAGELKTAFKKSHELSSHLSSGQDLDYYTDYWVKDNGFHADQIGYDIRQGDYNTFAVFKKDYEVKNFDVVSLFPVLVKMLKDVPNLYYAGFFRIDPLSELLPHKHSRRHLIFHLLLNDLENGACKLTCGDEERIIQHKGDAALFDYSLSHGTINYSTTERINLAIDFNPFTDS